MRGEPSCFSARGRVPIGTSGAQLPGGEHVRQQPFPAGSLMPRGSVRKRHTAGCPAIGTDRRCRCNAGWQARFYDLTGKRKQLGGFRTKKEADQALSQIQRELDRGTYREL